VGKNERRKERRKGEGEGKRKLGERKAIENKGRVAGSSLSPPRLLSSLLLLFHSVVKYTSKYPPQFCVNASLQSQNLGDMHDHSNMKALPGRIIL